MKSRASLLCLIGLSFSQYAAAEIAKHTTVTMDASGNRTEYMEMVADDNGNLRIEMYAVDGSGNRGALRDFVIFQANEQRMLTSSGGTCQAMSLDGKDLPGGISPEQMAQAQRALAEMKAQNPEMAKMLESQMGDMGAMLSGEQSDLQLVQSGQNKSIGDYDTTGFTVTGMPGGIGTYTVWAADVDDVAGAATISAASAGMMRAHKQMLDNMGVGEMLGTNTFAEIMDKMDDYYPIFTEMNSSSTQLISTNGDGSTDFHPACN